MDYLLTKGEEPSLERGRLLMYLSAREEMTSIELRMVLIGESADPFKVLLILALSNLGLSAGALTMSIVLNSGFTGILWLLVKPDTLYFFNKKRSSAWKRHSSRERCLNELNCLRKLPSISGLRA